MSVDNIPQGVERLKQASFWRALALSLADRTFCLRHIYALFKAAGV